MATPVTAATKPGYRGFLRFAEDIGLALEPLQRRIARVAGDARELLVCAMIVVLERGYMEPAGREET